MSDLFNLNYISHIYTFLMKIFWQVLELDFGKGFLFLFLMKISKQCWKDAALIFSL